MRKSLARRFNQLNNKMLIVAAVAAVGALGLLTPSAHGAPLVHNWTLAGVGSWNTAGNWSNGIPNAAGDSANIGNYNVTLNSNVTIGQIYGGNGGADTSVLVGTGNTLTMDNTGGVTNTFGDTNAAIYHSNSYSLTINPDIVIQNTNLDIGHTGFDGGITINGNITASSTRVLNLIASGSNAASVNINGNIGASGSNITINATGVNSGNATNAAVAIAGSLGSAVTAVNVNLTSGALVLSGTNTSFTGTVTLNTGILRLSSTTALGGGTLSITGGTLDSGTSNLVLAGTPAVNINGDFAFLGQQNLTLPGAVTLGTSAGTNRNITITANTLTLGGIISNGTTANSITKLGAAGNLVLTGANAYTGATTVSAGTLSIGSASVSTGSIQTTSGIAVNGGILKLDDTAGNVDRILDSGTVTMSNGGDFNLTGNATTNSTETVGTWAIDNGNSILSVASAASRTTTLAFNGGTSFTRSNNATALVRGTSLNQSVLANNNVSRITLATAPTGANFVGTATLTGGATNDGTQALKIIPWLVGDITATTLGSNFVTYDTTLGLRVLLSTEQATLAANSTTAANPINAIAFNGSITAATGITVNSLLFNAAQALNSSGGSTPILAVNSGAVALLTNNAASIGSGWNKLLLNNGEGVITVTQNTLTINTPVDVSSGGGLTKSGGGTLVLASNNLYTGKTTLNQGTLTLSGTSASTGGTYIAGGTLNINNAGALGASGAITFANSGVTINNSLVATPIIVTGTHAQTWNGDFTFTGTSNLDLGSGAVTLGATRNVTVSGSVLAVGGIIGDGGSGYGITKAGNGVLAVNGSSTYSGATIVSNGVLRLLATALPSSSSNVNLTGGNIEITGNTSLTLGTAANQVQLTGATVGFGAVGTDSTLNLGTATWGTGGFTPTTSFQLGTTTSDHKITLTSNIALNGATRTINVVHGSATGADAEISGTISGAATFGITKTGSGWLTLSGNNTYDGVTTVSAGVLEVSSLNNVVGGTASSNLGKPTSSANGVISLSGSGTTTLRYIGGGETTDRVFGLGTNSTVQAIIDASGSGALVLSSNMSLTGYGGTGNIKTVVLAGSNTNINSIAGIGGSFTEANVGNTGGTSLLKSGSGTWLIAGIGTYSRNTTVSAGTLIVGADAITKLTQSARDTGPTLTAIDFTNNYYTLTGNTLVNGDKVVLKGTAPSGLAANTTYVVTNVGGNGAGTFQVAQIVTPNTAIDFGAGSSYTFFQYGALGTATNAFIGAVGLGDANTLAASAPTLLLGTGSTGVSTNRDITLTTSVLAGPLAATYTLGGNSNAVNTFSGLITANKNLTIAQVANTGSNGLAITGGITGSTLINTPTTITFGTTATGAINVSTTGISDGVGGGSTKTSVAVANGINTFSAVNGYTGATTINGGKLVLSGAGSINSSSGISINGTLSAAKFITNSSTAVTAAISFGASGGTLGGSGTISAAGGVTAGANAIISPGNSPSTQTYTTGLTFNTGSTYVWEHNAGNAIGTVGTNYDQLISGGSGVITVNGGTLSLNFDTSTSFTNSFWDTTRNWTIILASGGTVTGAGTFGSILLSGGSTSLVNASNTVSGQGTFSAALSGGNEVLTWTPAVVGPFTATSPIALGDILLNGSVSGTSTIGNPGTASGNYHNDATSPVIIVSGGSGTISAGGSTTLTASADSTSYGNVNSTFNIINDSTTANDATINVTANIGNAIATNGVDRADFSKSTVLSGNVLSGGSYAGLASRVHVTTAHPTLAYENSTLGTPNGVTPELGSVATIRMGTNSNAGTNTVTMAWRLRQADEIGPGDGALLPKGDGLIADVVKVSGIALTGIAADSTHGGLINKTDVYTLQMTYSNAGMGSMESVYAATGKIQLVTLNPGSDNVYGGTGDQWQNAVAGNFGSGELVYMNFQGSWDQFVDPTERALLYGGLIAGDTYGTIDASELSHFLGSWGVDIVGHDVWAVLNHDGQFSVVPEPASLGLLALGSVGLLSRRRRRVA